MSEIKDTTHTPGDRVELIVKFLGFNSYHRAGYPRLPRGMICVDSGFVGYQWNLPITLVKHYLRTEKQANVHHAKVALSEQLKSARIVKSIREQTSNIRYLHISGTIKSVNAYSFCQDDDLHWGNDLKNVKIHGIFKKCDVTDDRLIHDNEIEAAIRLVPAPFIKMKDLIL